MSGTPTFSFGGVPDSCFQNPSEIPGMPHLSGPQKTTEHIKKIEAAQRRVAKWVTHDYGSTSSVTEMLKTLNSCLLEQRHIDSRLVMMYKITYDFVAIPVSVYLISNRRESRFIHPLAYRQIHASTNYYKLSFSPRTAVCSFTGMGLITGMDYPNGHFICDNVCL